jgi:hypothetical protein
MSTDPCHYESIQAESLKRVRFSLAMNQRSLTVMSCLAILGVSLLSLLTRTHSGLVSWCNSLSLRSSFTFLAKSLLNLRIKSHASLLEASCIFNFVKIQANLFISCHSSVLIFSQINTDVFANELSLVFTSPHSAVVMRFLILAVTNLINLTQKDSTLSCRVHLLFLL